GVVADLAVMPDVGVGHDQDIAAHASNAPTLRSATSDADVLANDVAVADLQARGLATISDVLRSPANHGERVYLVVETYFRRSINYDMREQLAVLAQLYVRADHAISPDFARGGDLCSRIDDGRRMNVHG